MVNYTMTAEAMNAFYTSPQEVMLISECIRYNEHLTKNIFVLQLIIFGLCIMIILGIIYMINKKIIPLNSEK